MTVDVGAVSVVLNEGVDGAGPLRGASFVVKENIDVKGQVSTNGHPQWASTHAPAAANAQVVDRLLAAGARLVGKTHMDEMAYSLLGANPHFGTPINPAAPDRHPGGSSSGSAVAVAAGLVNFAIGTDTAGSCRAPAAFCGVFGFRSSHGAIPMGGVIPLAPSLDVIGWFARDLSQMAAVGEALLPHDADNGEFHRAVLLSDGFRGVETEFAAAAAPATDMLKSGPWQDGRLDEEFFKSALAHFRNLQAYEAWASHGAWISANHPAFGKGVEERFAIASKVTLDQKKAAEDFREEAKKRIDALFGDDGFLVMPTAPFRAPLLNESEEQLDAKRYQMMRLFLIASYFGLPQISLPLPANGEAPVALSFVGRRGADRRLIALAQRFCGKMKK
ncbi:amidase [Methylocystis parvus]|uniref:Amidase n=1 Tax=Methylocystis parvus TaxID=134 RepID=A0A6B8MA63_9HYPH|nr:amidase [Methylocystis parvus]QGM98489.1 amidase [Methylocystis parvus]WBK01173.1 amidase [Methylocystis parvus OBBP]